LASNDITTNDLINIAIGLEKQGIAYYDVMALSTWHEVASDLFRHLREMERNHLVIFQNMLSEMPDYGKPEKLSAEHKANIQALIDTAVFTDEMAASELATHIDNEDEALDIAIGAEKDTILFYYNMSEIVPVPVGDTVHKIILEEKSHLAQLSELKQKLISLK
jgi:rubrerythrin